MDNNQRTSNKLSKMEKIILSLANIDFLAGSGGSCMVLYADNLDYKTGIKSYTDSGSYIGNPDALNNLRMGLTVGAILLDGALGFSHYIFGDKKN